MQFQHNLDFSQAIATQRHKQQELKRQLDNQIAEKSTLREINRLFPDGRLTVTSKPLLSNLNLRRPRVDETQAIRDGDQQVDMEIQRLKSIIDHLR